MRKTIVAVLAAGLVVLTAPVSTAATLDVHDPSGDVMTASEGADGHVSAYHREGGAEGDITFLRVQHTPSQVVVYVRYTQLSVPVQYGDFTYDLEGNNHHEAFVEIQTRHGKPQGTGDIFNNTGDQCRMSYRINYGTDSVSMRFPRACLYFPKYVRLTQVSSETRVMPDGSDTRYFDSPTRDGGTENQVNGSKTHWVVVG